MADGEANNDEHDVGRRRQVSDEEILNALATGKERVNAPALSTSDISDILPISRQAVKRRLEKLADQGEIGMHKAGRNRFWWLTDETHGPGQFDLDDVIEVDDLSHERLIELFREQIEIDELPSEVVDEIMDVHLTPGAIENETLFEALEQHVELTELPKSVTSTIAREVYGYNPSYWAKQVRAGIYLLAAAMVSFIVLFISAGFSPPEVPIPLITQDLLRDMVDLVVVISGIATGGFIIAGFLAIFFGFVGGWLSSIHDFSVSLTQIHNILKNRMG